MKIIIYTLLYACDKFILNDIVERGIKVTWASKVHSNEISNSLLLLLLLRTKCVNCAGEICSMITFTVKEHDSANILLTFSLTIKTTVNDQRKFLLIVIHKKGNEL